MRSRPFLTGFLRGVGAPAPPPGVDDVRGARIECPRRPKSRLETASGTHSGGVGEAPFTAPRWPGFICDFVGRPDNTSLRTPVFQPCAEPPVGAVVTPLLAQAGRSALHFI